MVQRDRALRKRTQRHASPPIEDPHATCPRQRSLSRDEARERRISPARGRLHPVISSVVLTISLRRVSRHGRARWQQVCPVRFHASRTQRRRAVVVSRQRLHAPIRYPGPPAIREGMRPANVEAMPMLVVSASRPGRPVMPNGSVRIERISEVRGTTRQWRTVMEDAGKLVHRYAWVVGRGVSDTPALTWRSPHDAPRFIPAEWNA